MDLNKLLSNEVFNGVSEEKINTIKDLFLEIPGKGLEDVMLLVMECNNKLNKDNPINEDQKIAIMNFLLNSLTKEQKDQVELILKIIGI